MSALDEFERRFTLADAALPQQQDALAIDLNHDAVPENTRSQLG